MQSRPYKRSCTSAASRLEHAHQHLRLAPQFFQFIVFACFCRKEVDDHIAIVQQRPAPALAGQPFGVQRADILLELELFLHNVFDRARLALVIDRGDDEVSGDAGKFVDV